MREFFLHKKNGEITNMKVLANNLNELEDGPYMVKITSKKRRTHNQNAWLHAVLPDIVDGLRNAGYDDVKTPEDAKAVIKALFFKKKITNGSDEIEIIEGTSEVTKLEFAEKATEIIDWAAEYLGKRIAPPDKQLQWIDL